MARTIQLGFLNDIINDGTLLDCFLCMLSKADIYGIIQCNARIFLAVVNSTKTLELWQSLRVNQHLQTSIYTKGPLLFAALKRTKHLHSSKEFLTASLLQKIVADAKSIETVHIHLLSKEALRKCITPVTFPLLRKLHLGGVGYSSPGLFSDVVIRDVLNHVGPQLDSFRLTKINDLTSLSFDCVSYFCTIKLTELRIISCAGMQRTIKPSNVRQFLTTCGQNLEYFDLRYSMEMCDEIIKEFENNTPLKLTVFMASRSTVYESVCDRTSEAHKHKYMEKYLKASGHLSTEAWESFIKCFQQRAKLLYIDDISGEVFSNSKPKFMLYRIGIDEEEMSYLGGIPMASQVIFQPPPSNQRKHPSKVVKVESTESAPCEACLVNISQAECGGCNLFLRPDEGKKSFIIVK